MDKHMDEIGTLLHHETKPSCCGCWTIQYGNSDGWSGLRAECNECGATVDLLPALTPATLSPELAEAVEHIEWALSRANGTDEVALFLDNVRTLLRAVRATAPGLTEAQMEAVRQMVSMLETPFECNCGRKHGHFGTRKFRAAFPAVFTEGVGE